MTPPKANPVQLVDGRTVMSDSPEWKFECMAAHILNMPTVEARRAALRGKVCPTTNLRKGGILQRSGEEHVKALEDKILELWRARKAAKAGA